MRVLAWLFSCVSRKRSLMVLWRISWILSLLKEIVSQAGLLDLDQVFALNAFLVFCKTFVPAPQKVQRISTFDRSFHYLCECERVCVRVKLIKDDNSVVCKKRFYDVIFFVSFTSAFYYVNWFYWKIFILSWGTQRLPERRTFQFRWRSAARSVLVVSNLCFNKCRKTKFLGRCFFNLSHTNKKLAKRNFKLGENHKIYDPINTLVLINARAQFSI